MQFTLYVTMTCVCSNLSVTAAANQLEHCRVQRQDTRERMLEQVEQLPKIPNRFKTMIQEALQLAEMVNDDQEEEEDYEDDEDDNDEEYDDEDEMSDIDYENSY